MTAISRRATLGQIGRPPRTFGPTERVTAMSTFLWIVFVVLSLTALISLGMMTLRKGHTLLFVVGSVLPILWIVGALMAPTPPAAGAV
jgi:hypothetical protein